MNKNIWTEEMVNAHLSRFNRPAVPVANVERYPRHEAKATAKVKEIHSRVCIAVHHRSRRAADATGRAHKWAVDGLVRGGLLIDDSPAYVAEIKETFEIGKDQTIIEIFEVE